MIKTLKCPNCNSDLLIHSKTTEARCPECREKFLIRESDQSHFEEATKVFTPEK